VVRGRFLLTKIAPIRPRRAAELGEAVGGRQGRLVDGWEAKKLPIGARWAGRGAKVSVGEERGKNENKNWVNSCEPFTPQRSPDLTEPAALRAPGALFEHSDITLR
jgi:hypothetical protein